MGVYKIDRKNKEPGMAGAGLGSSTGSQGDLFSNFPPELGMSEF
jgi:hypothetical protein